MTMIRKAIFKPQIRTERLQRSLTTLNFPRGRGVIGQSRHSGANLRGFSLETLDLVPGQDFGGKISFEVSLTKTKICCLQVAKFVKVENQYQTSRTQQI